MLTYDNSEFGDDGSFDDLLGSFPDLIECGETDLYWINMRRSTKKMELISKVTGAFFASFPLEEATGFGLNPAQISAGKAALELRRPVV